MNKRLLLLILLIPVLLVGETRRDLRVAAYFQAGLDTLSDHRLDTTVLNDYVTRSQYDVSVDLRCVKKLDTLIPGLDSTEYTLNSDCLYGGVVNVFVKSANSREFRGLVYKEAEEFSKHSQTTLEYYMTFKNLIYFNSITPADTSDTIVVHYIACARELTQDTMLSDISSEYTSLVIYKTCQRIFENLKKMEIANQYKADYQGDLQLKLQMYEFKGSEPIPPVDPKSLGPVQP